MEIENPTTQLIELHLQKFNTNTKQVDEDVQMIMQWYKQQAHLPQDSYIDDSIVKRLLFNCKFSTELTKQTIDLHFTLKVALPEFFTGRDPMRPEVQRLFRIVDIAFSKRVTHDGYRLTFCRLNDKDASKFIVENNNYGKLFFMLGETRIATHKELSLGDIVIFDCKNATMGHFTKMTLEVAQLNKINICSKKAYPTNVQGIHFVNPPAFMESVLTLCRAFLKKKMLARIYVHTCMSSLHRHVAPEFLPPDYGGDGEDLSVLAGEWRRRTENLKDWFLEQEAICRVDESKRPGKSVDTNQLFGIEGSFKKLTVD